MEKRVLIAVILSLGVLFLYPHAIELIYPTQDETKPVAALEEVVTAPADHGAIETAAIASVQKEGTATSPATAMPASPLPKNEAQSIVETPNYKAIFTNLGGGIKSWKLKGYNNTQDEGSPKVDLAINKKWTTTNTTTLIIGDVTHNIVFAPAKPYMELREGERGELVFTGSPIKGVTVEKKYLFNADGYLFDTWLKVYNDTNFPLTGHIVTAFSTSFAETASGKVKYHSGPIIQTAEKLLRQDEDEFQLNGRGYVPWIGLEDKYFLMAMIPPKITTMTWNTEIPAEGLYKSEVRSELNIAPGTKTEYAYSVFSGPKLYNHLKTYGVALEGAIEFGFFKFMAKPFLAILNQFQKYVKNYALAIILFTFIIKVIFYPLTKHSLTSMKEMQKVQPQMKAIKEKYKSNKEKMNKETMALYKKYKINPLSGCLPMVAQIPVFIALYEVLYVAIELRHAPFFLWIADLSAKDPYYITPLLMGGSMFLQQKMSPSSPDPTQAKMMMLMPVVFTFMFLSFPSGLVLYWLVNNVLSIAQQYKINKSSASPKPPKAKPAKA
ncbi:MAG: membrane protein insertase YidC [Thermodesulfobacteriota bacterium]